MSRPAKSAGLRSGHMTKNEKETRTIAENTVKGRASKLTPLKHLTEEQVSIFRKLVKELRNSNVLSNLDVYVLSNCAIAIDRVRQYDEMIAADHDLLCDRDVIGNRNKTVSEFLRYCNELCLSPQARAKIGAAAIAKIKTENPEEAFLRGITEGVTHDASE